MSQPPDPRERLYRSSTVEFIRIHDELVAESKRRFLHDAVFHHTVMAAIKSLEQADLDGGDSRWTDRDREVAIRSAAAALVVKEHSPLVRRSAYRRHGDSHG